MKYLYGLQEPDFTVTNIDLQNVSRPKNYRHSFRSGRGKHGFIYIVKGRMCDSFPNGENLFAAAGELLFLPKGSIYTGIYLEENTEIKIVQFDLSYGTLPNYLSHPTKIDLPNAGELIETFFMPIEKHKSKHPFYYLFCFYRLLWQIEELYENIPPKFQRLQPALTKINEHWQENEKVSHYANLCNMSEVHFRRLFCEYTGMSPIEYRNDIRLTHARSKLQSGEYNISETADLCGFSNLSFFIRLYKKKFGCTPKKG